MVEIADDYGRTWRAANPEPLWHDPPTARTAEPVPAVRIVDADDDLDWSVFWSARPFLAHVHTFARARRVAPWAVLGVVLARVVTATPYQVHLPPIVGGRASLNLFVGLVGKSGGGKGGAEAAAADALRVGHVDVERIGSGEGIAHGFRRRDRNEIVWRDDNHAVMFTVPEIDTLAALGDRKGATLMPELRSAWSGEQLGFGYADPAKRLPVPAHQYRMCLVAGIQPARSRGLLEDSDGGTPQRFLWLPVDDPEAPDEAPRAPEPLIWRPPTVDDRDAHHGVQIDVCETARRAIDQARVARLRGEHGDDIDGHALLARLKVAAALGVVDQRYSVTDHDWYLAGLILHRSDRTRAECRRVLNSVATTANRRRAEEEADRQIIVGDRVVEDKVRKACQAIKRKLERTGDWTNERDVKTALGREAEHFPAASERLVAAGEIESQHTAKTTKWRLVGGAS